jgi:hypothetical protein
MGPETAAAGRKSQAVLQKEKENAATGKCLYKSWKRLKE